jgi:diguanylate cyclase (GGDEF)-like protein
MISLKKYLDTTVPLPQVLDEPDGQGLLAAAIAAYRSALLEFGNCSQDACPALGNELKKSLGKLEESLSIDTSREVVEVSERCVRDQLQEWGRRTARHYQQKATEVKDILMVMARAAESVGARDQRCAGQISEVTTRLERIASLEDLTQVRASIEKSAADLRTSVDRMTAEGKAAIEKLRAEVSNYQAKLEEAEETVSRDALTGLRSRLCAESQIEGRIEVGVPFCVAIIDVDGFKLVNDEYGHLAGDELLKELAIELQSARHATDLIGRWGGDEFILLMDCGLSEAKPHIARLMEWVCGTYTIQGKAGPKKLSVSASVGLAEHRPGETMNELLARADAEMYQHKAASRAIRNSAKR